MFHIYRVRNSIRNIEEHRTLLLSFIVKGFEVWTQMVFVHGCWKASENCDLSAIQVILAGKGVRGCIFPPPAETSCGYKDKWLFIIIASYNTTNIIQFFPISPLHSLEAVVIEIYSYIRPYICRRNLESDVIHTP